MPPERERLSDFAALLRRFASGRASYAAVWASFMAPYLEEEGRELDDDLEVVHAFLLPVLQAEFPPGSPGVGARLRRLLPVLEAGGPVEPEAVLLALQGPTVTRLLRKRDGGVIPPEVLRDQVRKLSPARFDVGEVLRRAERAGETERAGGDRVD